MTILTDEAKALLKTVVEYHSFGVYADNIQSAALLLKVGYVTAEQDYEGPRMFPTESGQQAAVRFKLVPADGQCEGKK